MCSRPWRTSSAESTDGRPDCGVFQRAGGTVKQLEKQAQHLASGPVDITCFAEDSAARGWLRSKGIAT